MNRTSGDIDATQPSTGKTPPQHVCIALPARGGDYDEMGRILAQVVREVGAEARIVRDGDGAALDCDALILFGKCSAFTRSARLLAACSARRPATILWHIEPLLPEAIPQVAERTCRVLARCDWSILPKPLSKVITQIPGSGLLRDAARTMLSDRLKHLSGWDDRPPYTRVHSRQWFHAAQHHAWLREHHSDCWCDLVAVSTMPRYHVLRQMGIRCTYAPVGYHPAWGCDLGLNRDVDVLFLGRVKRTSRQAVLSHARRQLQQHGIRLTVVDRNCFGQDRTELLSRTRIVLDVIQNAWEMPVVRPLTSMACGALVVSNWMSDPSPFGPEHLVRVESHLLADAVLHYLQAEPERRRIAQAARQYVTKELTWHKTVSRLLQGCRAEAATTKGVMV
ncbi:MAG: glycosyltransferase family 1 protein [Sedimentisphaerales bacterium]|nr:glycosyltransferase family 1 protein [Sedimentisphaerales bacterium]